MDRNIRYEVLSGEEEHVPATPVVLAMVVPPGVYSEARTEHMNSEAEPLCQKLPTYEEATTLPSYDEAEKLKAEEAARQSTEERRETEDHDRLTGMTIGTDCMFLCTFILSFLFNWIGFLFSLCITDTVAGRCGALSGLGLSIVKWVAIVKHNQWAEGFAEADSWIWWLLILCGFMIFVRGAVQYAKVKYEWQKLRGHLRRYYFF